MGPYAERGSPRGVERRRRTIFAAQHGPWDRRSGVHGLPVGRYGQEGFIKPDFVGVGDDPKGRASPP